MKTLVYTQYGPPEVLRFEELPKPTPKPNEVLVRTRATTVTSGDWRVRSLEMPTGFGLIARFMFGITGPRQTVLGAELAGTIEAVGDEVTQFRVGDSVFAFTGSQLGCYTEFKCFAEDGNLVVIPEGLSFHEAAALSFGGTTALDFFRKGNLNPGESVLINGASGCVGTAAVQIAKHQGATVTGVCSGANLELVRSLGADDVINYVERDFAKENETYDIVLDTTGTVPFSRAKPVLKSGGRLLAVLGGLGDMLRMPWVSLTNDKRIIAGPAAERLDDLQQLAALAGTGEFKPVIDAIYPVDEIIDAHRRVDTGRKRGSVVVSWE